MRIPTILSAVALAACAQATSALAQDAQPPDAAPHTRTHAQWIIAPNTLELVWPGYAFMAHMNGHVVLDCAINEKFKLKPCDVVEETPLGQGFAKSALDYLQSTKMRPAMIDGAPIPDPRVKITIDFIGANGGIRWSYWAQ